MQSNNRSFLVIFILMLSTLSLVAITWRYSTMTNKKDSQNNIILGDKPSKNPNGIVNVGPDQVSRQPIQVKKEDDIKSSVISLKNSFGKVSIVGGSDLLAEGYVESNRVKPTISSKKSDSIHTLVIDQQANTEELSNYFQNTDLKLNPIIPTILTMNVRNSDITLDLNNVSLSNVQANLRFSTLIMDLSNTKLLHNFSLNGNTSSITLRVPRTLGLKIKTNITSSSLNIPEFKKVSDEEYVSSFYEKAQNQVTLDLTLNAADFTIVLVD